MAGTPVKSGAICGTFLCGQKVCGQVDWSAPFTTRPVIILGPGVFQIFSVPPVEVSIGKPLLTLVPRGFLIEARQSPQFAKPLLILIGRPTQAEPMIFVQMVMPWLELRSRAFLPSISSTPALAKPQLLLLARVFRGRIPILIPSEEVDWILDPTDMVSFSPPAALEEDLLLVPTVEAVG